MGITLFVHFYCLDLCYFNNKLITNDAYFKFGIRLYVNASAIKKRQYPFIKSKEAYF